MTSLASSVGHVLRRHQSQGHQGGRVVGRSPQRADVAGLQRGTVSIEGCGVDPIARRRCRTRRRCRRFGPTCERTANGRAPPPSTTSRHSAAILRRWVGRTSTWPTLCNVRTSAVGRAVMLAGVTPSERSAPTTYSVGCLTSPCSDWAAVNLGCPKMAVSRWPMFRFAAYPGARSVTTESFGAHGIREVAPETGGHKPTGGLAAGSPGR